jgi:RNA ligase (TIGR02306 family)
MRKLVTIRQISEIKPIINADAIEVVVLDGWEVVTKKGEFKVDDYVLYFEIDCLLPMADSRFSFLAKGKDIEKYRLRTIKLRGQISQGLVLPLELFPEFGPPQLDFAYEELLGIEKYEIPDSGNIRRCKPASTFPHFIPKTDEDRIQNLYNKFKDEYLDVEFHESEKLDGSSITIAAVKPQYFIENLLNDENYPYNSADLQVLVASRNQTLKYDEDSHYWKGIHNTNLIAKISKIVEDTGKQLAIQGELLGPGIQGNREALADYTVRVFKIWDIDKKEYLSYEDFINITTLYSIDIVPQLGKVKLFSLSLPAILERSKGKNSNKKNIEGKVYTTCIDGNTVHFKVINNDYLLEKDK